MRMDIVDREARNKMAEQIRHFVAGLLTNDEFCNSLPRSNYDCSVNYLENLAQFEFEGLCCKPYRINWRRKLMREERLLYARWVLFLQTDLDYEYDKGEIGYCIGRLGGVSMGILCFTQADSVATWLASYVDTFTAGLLASLIAPVFVTISSGYVLGFLTQKIAHKANHGKRGDESVWPFYRRSDYDEALKHPKLLCDNK